MTKYIYLDAEYNNTTEEKLNVVCMSFLVDNKISNFWLNGDDDTSCIAFINQYKGYTFVSFNVEAESSAFISLGLDPVSFTWVDLYLEYRQLLNHNHKLQYGKQLIEGKETITSAPKSKWESTEEERKKQNNSKPSYSLSAACYKLLNIKIDTARKDKMRNIIIHSLDIEGNKEEILNYCDEDTIHLPKLLDKIMQEYSELPYTPSMEEMVNRAEYSARTAKMVSLGYPVDVEAVTNFSNSVQDIIWEVQNEINELFPEITPFRKNKNRRFSWNQKATRDWIVCQKFDRWLRTDKGSVSLSLEAFSQHFHARHSFSKDCFGSQMVRYLKLKQSLNGFSPTAKNKFTDSLGSDGRVRSYFGIFGSQSGRSQPKATGFLFLKSAWMRALCSPKKGRAIGSIDYKSQEFLLAAVMSGDRVMIDAYLSGDPYFFFAKQAKAVPPGGTKEEYSRERNLFKATTLGLSYDMGAIGLAEKLTKDLGENVSEEKAQTLIDLFYSLYSRYKRYKLAVQRSYIEKGYLRLRDGWCLWGDNKNKRSVGNFPVQGMGAVIMRKAVALAQDAGLDVIMTLHDALYIEFDSNDFTAMTTLAKCMQDAFKFNMLERHKSIDIGLDANCWSKDYEDTEVEIEGLGMTKVQNIYIDGRSIEEYNKFKQYFTSREFNL